MIADRPLRVALRAIAVAIAAAAIVDPAVTTARTTKPDVVVLADSARDGRLADDVARALAKQFSVVRGPFAGAAATVVAGDVPRDPIGASGPVFVVRPSPEESRVRITSVEAPHSASVASRVPIAVATRVTHAKGRHLALALRSGELTLARATAPVESDDASIETTLAYVPTTAAVAPLRVTASLDDDESAARSAAADLAVDVRDRRWSVLFYDPRPSWMSTFVRRAVERDPRFVVTSRVVTSRGITTDAGRPPMRLDDLAGLSAFDAVVVGAAQSLSAADAAGLETFMRRRGASVVLLLDEATAGAHDRLAGVGRWVASTAARPSPLAVQGHDSLAMIGASFAEPATLPATAEVMVGGSRPIVWRESVGAGTLVVSGLLDAWRYRDRPDASFDRTWQTLIADAASATLAAIAPSVTPAVAAAGERVTIAATLRDVSLAAGSSRVDASALRASLLASSDSTSARQSVRVWPAARGEVTATLRAPRTPGVYRVAFATNEATNDVPLVVLPRVARPSLDDDQVARSALASGGDTISASRLGDLPRQIAAVVRPAPRAITWRPMRSPWWILPFTLALAGEWWLRRRRGLA